MRKQIIVGVATMMSQSVEIHVVEPVAMLTNCCRVAKQENPASQSAVISGFRAYTSTLNLVSKRTETEP